MLTFQIFAIRALFSEKMPANTHICEIKLMCIGIFSLYTIGCVSIVL